MKRNEVEAKYKWDLSPIVKDDGAWDKLLTDLKGRANGVAAFKGKLGNKADALACFRARDAFSVDAERLYAYAHMKSDEDTKNDLYKGMADKARALYVQFGASAAYIAPELTALPDAVLKGYITDADFSDWEYELSQILRKKAHILGDKEEKLLAMSLDFTGAFFDTFQMLDNADLALKPVRDDKGEVRKMSHGVYGLLLQNPSRKVRAAAFKSMYAFFSAHINTIAANYAGYVKKNIFYSRARNYSDCIQSFTDGDDVSAAVYKKLVAAARKNIAPVHEYVKYRKAVIGAAELKKTGKPYSQHMYDMYIPIVPGAEISLPYEKAYDLVIEGLKPLGEEYGKLLKEAFSGGWIDVRETENKRSGAYCGGEYTAHPYVLLNYQQTTHDVFTIAHEMGHAMHSWYSNKNNPYAKASYRIFVAEVASTVNEMLLLKHLLKAYANDKNVKRYLLSYQLDTFRTTFFRQTMFAEFEAAAHAAAEKGEPLTPEFLNKLYFKLNKKYYGSGVIHDKQIAFEWARIPHFYMGFYVYKYATGITSAACIAEDILKNGAPAVARYKKFLAAGGSKSPYEILKDAGVDLATDAPYENAMSVFAETLAQLKASE